MPDTRFAEIPSAGARSAETAADRPDADPQEALAQDERRRDERIHKVAYARVSAERADGTADHALGIVSNVSLHGLGVRTPGRFSIGEAVILRVAAHNRLHNLRAAVRHADATDYGLWDVGLEFDPSDDASRDFLEAFLPCILLRACPA
jgi:hypothetical protein